jgi:outer membrane biogenesis lipoprotein LolB
MTPRILLLAGMALLLTGCASLGPRPWEKDLMARHEMQVDPYPLQTAAEDHVYFSKEASSGGSGFAGGGCGCN